MSIQQCALWRRGISSFLILAFLAAVADNPAFGRPAPEKAIRVTNQEVRVEGDVALIRYDLQVPEEGTYLIAVELRRENDPSFSLVPSNLTGDIGEVRSSGPRKLIRWDYAKDFPFGLHGEDYYFRIEVNRAGGFPWLWVGLGSAAAAGVVVVLARKSSAASASPAMQALGLPPAR